MGTRVSHPLEVKQKAVEMRLAGVPVKKIMQELNIKNETQIMTWVRWYKSGETHRFEQPVGKQYTFGKDPNYSSDILSSKVYVNINVYVYLHLSFICFQSIHQLPESPSVVFYIWLMQFYIFRYRTNRFLPQLCDGSWCFFFAAFADPYI